MVTTYSLNDVYKDLSFADVILFARKIYYHSDKENLMDYYIRNGKEKYYIKCPKLTQKKAAEMLTINSKTLGDYENQKIIPSDIRIIIQIGKIYELDWLFLSSLIVPDYYKYLEDNQSVSLLREELIHDGDRWIVT